MSRPRKTTKTKAEEISIWMPEKLIPVFQGRADVRWACGGRGSGKTRNFATMTSVRGYERGMAGDSGIILCGRQYQNSLKDSSFMEVSRAIEESALAPYYDIGKNYIRSRDGRIEYAFAGVELNVQSLRSKGKLLLVWIDEAEPITESAFMVIEPTLREEGKDWSAELWLTWNPMRKGAAVEKLYRYSKNPMVKGVELNWRDNPKFPAKLERDRIKFKEESAEQYDHVWEGGYITTLSGAYYAAPLLQAQQEGRIGNLAADPNIGYRAVCDIGGTGADADAFVIWIVQFVAREIRYLNYYEAVGQPLAAHLEWLRENGYREGNTTVWLPHDGDSHERVFDASYASSIRKAGYKCQVVPNQGRGAAKARIEAARKLFPSMWFHKERTENGRAALGWYHEKKDDKRGMGLGPEHDWASHGADAFGMSAVIYQMPAVAAPKAVQRFSSWMA